jgi:FeS assembly SUF system protein
MTEDPGNASNSAAEQRSADKQAPGPSAGKPVEQASAASASHAAPLAPGAGAGNASGLCDGKPGESELARLTDEVIAALKTVYDPEIPSDIYELGLIYKIDIADDRKVAIEMTLTTPNCPSAQELPSMVENAVASVPGVGEVKVDIVWDPPWDPGRMSDEARAVLNMW